MLEDVIDEYVSLERAELDYGVVITPIDPELDKYEIDFDATEAKREEIRSQRDGWLEEDASSVAERYSKGDLSVHDVIRRYGVVLDWGTGELYPKTTEEYRALMRKRSQTHWS